MNTIELGDVSVTRVPHLDDWPLSPAAFFPGGDAELWEANRSWLSPAHWDADADRVRVAVQSWLLRSADRTILIDTGLAADTARPGVPAGAAFPTALAAVGVTPADVDLVICTHLHADHVGWNTRLDASGRRVPTFPNARYVISRPDLDFFDSAALTEEPGRSATVHAESIEPILRAGQALIWDDAYVIDENLRLALAPGHTPGHGVVTLDSGGDRAIFVGDLLHAPVQLLEPQSSSCFCHDPVTAARTRRTLLRWAADHAALVIPAHFGGGRAVTIDRDGFGFAVRRWAAFSDDLFPSGGLRGGQDVGQGAAEHGGE
jgi:glyoxylase-like metal-dependent hydrolase (beta-lactamase superfamily II)